MPDNKSKTKDYLLKGGNLKHQGKWYKEGGSISLDDGQVKEYRKVKHLTFTVAKKEATS